MRRRRRRSKLRLRLAAVLSTCWNGSDGIDLLPRCMAGR
jgi:hypothetical protein